MEGWGVGRKVGLLSAGPLECLAGMIFRVDSHLCVFLVSEDLLVGKQAVVPTESAQVRKWAGRKVVLGVRWKT